MDDLIRRQDVIDALDIAPPFEDYVDYELALEVIKDVPSAQQWIPCSDRMPEDGREVLAYTRSKEMIVAYVFVDWGDRCVWTTGAFGSGSVDVIAWTPLPEPYKGETETWNSTNGKSVTAPKGTFQKIYEDCKGESE